MAIEVKEHDVLFGRGGVTNKHVGNRVFRQIVAQHQENYLVTKKKREKRWIAQSIVNLIKQRGGRFLSCDAKKEWREVPEDRAREKTSQALREGMEMRRKSREGYTDVKSKKKQKTEQTPNSVPSDQVPSFSMPSSQQPQQQEQQEQEKKQPMQVTTKEKVEKLSLPQPSLLQRENQQSKDITKTPGADSNMKSIPEVISSATQSTNREKNFDNKVSEIENSSRVLGAHNTTMVSVGENPTDQATSAQIMNGLSMKPPVIENNVSKKITGCKSEEKILFA